MDGDLRGEGLVFSEALKEDLNKLALASRILEMEGHGDFTLGHLGMRDPEGRGVWIKRWGLTLGEVFDWTDHQLIDFKGKLLYGDGKKRHSEWPIHVAIYKARPDVMATAHTHPEYGTVFSCSKEPLRPLSNAGSSFYEPPPRFEETSELVRSLEVGERMAAVMGKGPAVFLRNHGVAFCGSSIEEMTVLGAKLEIACRQMIQIAASGMAYDWPEGDELSRKAKTMNEGRNNGLMFDYFTNRLKAAQEQGHPDLPKERRAAR